MLIFKCKICGGTLEFNPGDTIAICNSCDTKQTIPRIDDDRRANLYDRANHFRRNNEYDKAMGIYEKILNEDGTDAEAYWSIVLCKYGIEYVEDPVTHKRVPTVNRTQYTSIFDDGNYKSAIQYADPFQKQLYEEEASVINEIQKGILAISRNEEPFDVFICYKETDASGRRTQDSVLANDLYHQLTQEGFKVFFSRITLEDKLGTAYEPYIFAALNSAKVMVVIGTKPEYFNAVWVKNEWSRYLSLIKNGARKTLIPAYRDMDPYDLPDEFAHLQAQDMSKLGFMQDLIRGIKKTVADESATFSNETSAASSSAASNNIAPLIKRAFMFLEDGDFSKADEYCERVLDLDPENAQAYLGKLMVEQEVKNQENLADCNQPFDDNSNYKKAVRFADDDLRTSLMGYIEQINALNAQRKENAKRLAPFREVIKDKNCPVSIVCSGKNIAGVKADGTVVAVGDNSHGQCDVGAWTDIVSIACGDTHTVGLKADGRIVAVGGYFCGRPLVEGWTNIVSIACGDTYTVGLKADGTVVATNDLGVRTWTDIVSISYYKGYPIGLKSDGTVVTTKDLGVRTWTDIASIECSTNSIVGLKADGTVVATKDLGVRTWTDIVSIACGEDFTVGLKTDGTVVAVGDNSYGQCDVGDWTDIVSISCGNNLAVGLKSDGTVVVAGGDLDSRCEVNRWKLFDNLSQLQELTERKSKFAEVIRKNEEEKKRRQKLIKNKNCPVSIVCSGKNIAGVKADGTVVAVGDNSHGQCDVGAWTDIVSIACGDTHTVGLKADGRIVAVGGYFCGRPLVEGWTNIVSIACGDTYTVGLKADGTVVADGYSPYGQCDVGAWTDIVSIACGNKHTVGLKADGTVVAVGHNYSGQCDVGASTSFVSISCGSYHTVGLNSYGRVTAVGDNSYGQCDVGDWTDIVSISCGDSHTVGLTSDGRVVAVGDNSCGQCDVEDWTNIVSISCGGSLTVGLKLDGTVVAVGDNSDSQCEVNNWKLFDNSNQLKGLIEKRTQFVEELKKNEEEKKSRQKRLELQAARRAKGVCIHCGGAFEGLIIKKCSKCGKGKDY